MAYERLSGYDRLGFSLKPPKWLRKGAAAVTNFATGLFAGQPVQAAGVTVQIPSLNAPPPPTSLVPGVDNSTLLIGAGAVALLLLMKRR